MLSYPAAITLSTRTLNHLADLIRAERRRSRWRRLGPGQLALMALAFLRNGATYRRLAAGFQVGVSTVYRYCARRLTCSPPMRSRCTGWCIWPPG